MNLRNLVLSVLSVFAIGSQAHAGILLEPYLGYHLAGKHEYGGGGDDTIGGVTLGGRLAYQQLGLFVGADYMTSMWKLDSSPSADSTLSDLGVVVGYEFPVLLRVYGVYNFQAQNSLKFSGGTSKLEGSGFKLGVGTTMFPMVAIGLEYRTATYTKVNGNSLTSNNKENTYGLVVSLPLVF